MPILLLFCSLTSKAQNISIGNNQDVTVSKTDYDDCGSIFELSLDISNDYYFAFQLMEDGKMISSSNLEFTGDAAVFTFDNDKNVIHQSSQYAGSTTLYLNTRNGYPYVLSSDAPSLTDYFIKTSGKTTLQEGDAINFTTVVCPASDNYTYQWYENGTAIASQTNADLTSYTPTVANAEYKLEIKESDVVVASKTIKVNTLGVQTRFTLDDWWGITSATSSCKELVGYCNSVYLITLSYTDNNPKFAIKENGIEIGTDKVSVGSGISISSITGDNNSTPGWSATGQLNGETVVYYLDARTTPYKLTKTLSSADFLVTHITQTQGEENIQRGGKVSFSSNICGSIATEDVTYQWYESANGGLDWTAIEGATAATLIDKEPTTDGTTYKVIATVGSLTSNSNEIKINFLPSSVIVNVAGANKINSVEYEAPNNQEITITAKAVEMTDVTYNILYKTFEGKEWRDTTISGGEDFWTFTPSENLEYQITATGVSSSSQEIETYKTNILIRIIYQCDADSTIDTLWYDDFGHFLNSTTYIVKDAEGVEQTYSGSITNPQGQVSSIINYFSADPNFFVQKHDFAGQDPLFGPYDNQLCEADGYKHYACWEGCDGYRVEDGYYSILPNPDLSNCGMPDKKYWSGSDHTGNENGGMLFVHCAENSEQTIIYEREVKIDCDNGLLLFSAFISNASIVEGDKPVNLRLEIYNENGNLVDVVSSGDIMPRNTGEKWSKMTRKFNANRGQYTIKLINNTSFETVVLLDDISVAICYPGISLITDLRDPSIKLIDTWDLKDAVNLYAYNENDIKSYIDNPKYIFQYKKEGGNWFNLTSISSTDFTSIALTKNDIRFHGTTKFRTIVASSEEIINRITDGEELSLNCGQIYAIDSSFIIKFHYGEIIEIATADDLVEFREAINGPTKQYKGITLTDGGKDKFFKLTADIDLSSVCSATKGSWIPIGTFKGSFDGSGHAISNLYINSPGSDNQGLFGDINSAIIKNVQLVGADVTANKNVGGVCGEGVDSEISQCTISGSVSGTEKVGGVCGDISSSIISNCSNSSKLSGTSSVGGVCGYTTGSSIIGKCINIGKVSGENSTGGVCGYYESSTITSCYYDKQMCPVTNGIGSPAESTNAEGKLTTEMTNGSLFNDAANWEEVAGMYPRPKGIEKTDAAIVTAMPVFLSKEENVNEVTADFAVGTGNSVVWSSTNNGGNVSFENGKATISKNGEVTLTAAQVAATKNVTLTLKIRNNHCRYFSSRCSVRR